MEGIWNSEGILKEGIWKEFIRKEIYKEASLHVIPSSAVWLTHWRVGMLPRGILTGLRSQPCQPREVKQSQVQGPGPGMGQPQV